MDSLEVAVSKGKRMKRQRPPSPLWSSGGGGAASSSSSAGDFSPAPSSSGKVYESTEEDEDLAHCLILLAQGGPRRRRLSPESRRSSKKYTELVAGPVASGARAGFYVYECKTCSRVFPSFQALGGHRASHKKPKTTATEDVMKKSAAVAEYDDDDDEGHFSKFRPVSPPLCSSELLPSIAPNKLPPKIHECSICGSEFSSGQALGGHMRRHRAMVGGPGAQVVTVLGLESSAASDHHHHHIEEEKSRDVLSLDLNLPAPAEDQEHRDSKFQLVRRPLVLSSPALIDCHY